MATQERSTYFPNCFFPPARQQELHVPSIQTFVAEEGYYMRRRQRITCRVLSRPSPETAGEKHTLIFVGRTPIIDITDGHFNAMEMLYMQNNFTLYFSALRELRCQQNLEALLGDKWMEERLIGKQPRWWYHPYVLMSYYNIMSERTSEIIACDKNLILHSYQACIAHGGADYFNAFAHACLDYDIGIDAWSRFMLFMKFCDVKTRTDHVAHQVYVYLIQAEKTRMFKIGMSNDPEARRKALQAANHKRLRLVHTWAVADPYRTEQALHVLFADARQHGEWFVLSTAQEAELIIHMKQEEGS
jgi:hypothetical protein